MSNHQERVPKAVSPNRAPCLGCGGRIVLRRDAHCMIAGKRDGSVLLVAETRPLFSAATDLDRIFEPGMLLLGWAHRDCVERARHRLEAQEIPLPENLLSQLVEEDEGVSNLPKLHLPPEQGICPFCGGLPVTAEHVWPQWLSDELVGGLGGFVTQPEYGSRTRSKIDVIAPVCGSCNNDWLSVLENDVKSVLAPMLHAPKTYTLSVDDQRLLATWAVKTALMLDLCKGAPIIPTGFYHDLRSKRRPLEGQTVLLGAYCGSKWAIWAEHRGLRLGAPEGQPPPAFVTTFTAFRVVFQVVGQFNRGSTFKDDRLMREALHRIAPEPDGAIDWPKEGLAFGDDALLDLASSVLG